jgi:hypothetical protein
MHNSYCRWVWCQTSSDSFMLFPAAITLMRSSRVVSRLSHQRGILLMLSYPAVNTAGGEQLRLRLSDDQVQQLA